MDVEVSNIHKTFGKVHANNDISLSVRSGEVQGILGENGASKSTLMKILSGFISYDSGKILLDGREVNISSPADSARLGIGMLHQDPLDFPPFKVIDNLILGSREGMIPDRKKVREEFEALTRQFNFSISPDTYIEDLSVGERQQLEIIRLLWLGAEVLILDEPTTGISEEQKKQLFAMVRQLTQQGKAILFVSHKLEEVMSLCTKVAVFRQGRHVGEAVPPYDSNKLVEMMFGKTLARSDRKCCAQEKVNIEVSDLQIDDVRLPIRDVNFSIQKGEVIGLAGMEGSGQVLILRALAGIIRPSGGKIWLHEEEGSKRDFVGRHYFDYKDHGISFLPAARLEEGLIAGLDLREHFTLAEKQDGFFVDSKAVQKFAEQRIQEFNIKGTAENKIESLSGGNQQRAELALLRQPLRLLLLDHPTRGLDIESSQYIWSKLKQRCTEGASIIFISSDLDEISLYSDRILVFFGGRVSKPLDSASVTVEKIGELIGGKGWEKLGEG